MKPIYLLITILVIALATNADARKKKHKSADSSPSSKTKTKTKWSSSTDNGLNGAVVATEEHGYYVKRTYFPLNSTSIRQSPPYLAIPIAWFSCADDKSPADCHKSNSAAITATANALSTDGFLCEDDCIDPYAPICGKTNSEVAVFYNQCKLNVAKCRTHGLWQDISYTECQQMYPKETAHADKSFRLSPFFTEVKPQQQGNQKQEPAIVAEQQVEPAVAMAQPKVPTETNNSSNSAFNQTNDKTKLKEKMSTENNAQLAKIN